MEESTKPVGGIYKKLSIVMAEVEKVPKNGFNEFHKYTYATESDVSEHIRPLLSAQGLSVCFNVEEVERIQVREPAGNKDYPGDITRVKVKIVIGDESGETMESMVYGEGQDKGDKGIYKAYTGAVKYWLFKTFLISTGDDPEQHHDPAKQQQPAQAKPFIPQPARQEPPKSQPSMPEEHPQLKPMSDQQRKKLWAMLMGAGFDKDKAKEFVTWAGIVTSAAASNAFDNFDALVSEFKAGARE